MKHILWGKYDVLDGIRPPNAAELVLPLFIHLVSYPAKQENYSEQGETSLPNSGFLPL